MPESFALKIKELIMSNMPKAYFSLDLHIEIVFDARG